MRMLVKGLSISALVILLDQWSKYYVFKIIDAFNHPVIEVLPFFNLVKVYNYGVSFGMFNGLEYGKYILSAVAITITLILCFLLFKATKSYIAIAYGLIIGGAVGNIIDRITFGAVADFFDFYIGNYHWPAFNVADSAVCIGVFMILLEGIICKEKESQ
ncbi:MAG: lspA [Rickettsiaceae bacterium]|jgi:signal peptidase II|nr:lspA [Rickettsiaceae bacterium]